MLGTFACFGALAIALTTLTSKQQQVRPFMIALVLPAVFLLPSDSFFTFLREDSLFVWSQRLIEAGISAIFLAIMWYVFGPGRRTASGSTRAASQAESESSTSTDSVQSESTAETVSDGC